MEQELTSRKLRIHAKLMQVFDPTILDVVDDSARHAGHAGASPEGETHFNVHICAAAFADKSRIERHRMVQNALADEFETGLHALSIKAEPL